MIDWSKPVECLCGETGRKIDVITTTARGTHPVVVNVGDTVVVCTIDGRVISGGLRLFKNCTAEEENNKKKTYDMGTVLAMLDNYERLAKELDDCKCEKNNAMKDLDYMTNQKSLIFKQWHECKRERDQLREERDRWRDSFNQMKDLVCEGHNKRRYWLW